MEPNHSANFSRQREDDTDPILTPRRYHYLLCAEGISYFLLALLEFLAHTIPNMYQDLFIFEIVDIVLGI